jgi:hypothetical protein
MGGDEAISHSERVLINRASMLTLQLEMLDRTFAANDFIATPRQIDRYQRVVNTLRRTLESLGLQSRSRDITPTMQENLAHKAREKEEQDATAD